MLWIKFLTSKGVNLSLGTQKNIFLKRKCTDLWQAKREPAQEKIFLTVNFITLIREDKDPVGIRSHAVSSISAILLWYL